MNRTKSGEIDVEPLLAVGRIADALISARIARGMTQRQLASLVGLKEQQIQRYEARDYAKRGPCPGSGDRQGLGVRFVLRDRPTTCKKVIILDEGISASFRSPWERHLVSQ